MLYLNQHTLYFKQWLEHTRHIIKVFITLSNNVKPKLVPLLTDIKTENLKVFFLNCSKVISCRNKQHWLSLSSLFHLSKESSSLIGKDEKEKEKISWKSIIKLCQIE